MIIYLFAIVIIVGILNCVTCLIDIKDGDDVFISILNLLVFSVTCSLLLIELIKRVSINSGVI